MLFSVGFPVWETTFINPHGWAFPLSSHRMLRGRYLQQDAETPCPRHSAWSSCKCSALFYPPVILIQQGAPQLWGIFLPMLLQVRAQRAEGWDHIMPAALSQGGKMFLTRNSEASFYQSKGMGWKICCHPPPKCEHFVVPHSFSPFLR